VQALEGRKSEAESFLHTETQLHEKRSALYQLSASQCAAVVGEAEAKVEALGERLRDEKDKAKLNAGTNLAFTRGVRLTRGIREYLFNVGWPHQCASNTDVYWATHGPLQDIRLVRGLCTRINTIICKHPLRLGTPLAPFIAHAIAQYSVSPRPSFIAIHAIQYW